MTIISFRDYRKLSFEILHNVPQLCCGALCKISNDDFYLVEWIYQILCHFGQWHGCKGVKLGIANTIASSLSSTLPCKCLIDSGTADDPIPITDNLPLSTLHLNYDGFEMHLCSKFWGEGAESFGQRWWGIILLGEIVMLFLSYLVVLTL